MDIKLDANLCKKYPHLYADRNLSMQETCMVWGFECGDGWYKIIDELSAVLEALIVEWVKNDPENSEHYPRASQVKEKYGTLSFYMTSGTDEMDAFIRTAEIQSSNTCERCGKPGKMRGHGWYYTACARHTRKEDKGNA
jgi:hypothetical protein